MSMDLEARVENLETWKNAIEVSQVGMTYQQKYLEERFDRIDRRLDRYDAHITKFVLGIGALFMAAFVAFIIRGGLSP